MSTKQISISVNDSIVNQIRQLFTESLEKANSSKPIEEDILEHSELEKQKAFVKCDLDILSSLYIHSNMNIEGNYELYLTKSLQTINYLRTLKYGKALKEQKESLGEEVKTKISKLAKNILFIQ